MLSDRLITVAIHTYDRAHQLKQLLESEGIQVVLQNVNLTNPSISAGVRVRIHECDLPLALRVIENIEIFSPVATSGLSHSESRTILVPVDFSPNSDKAVTVAFHIARLHKAYVHLIHSYIDPAFARTSMQLTESLTFEPADDIIETEKEEESMARIAQNAMERFEATLRDKIKDGVLPPVKFTSSTAEGLPEEVVDDYVSSHKIMLTVMGTRGADSRNRELMGSVTAEVLDACRTPVFTIPESIQLKDIRQLRNVIYFTASRQEDILALDALYRLFPDVHFSITLVALPPSRFSSAHPEDLDNLLTYCRENYPAYTFHTSPLSLSNPVDDFEKISSAHPVDMIVVGSRRKNIFARLFNPTLAHRLLFHADIPMMSIPVRG